MKKKQNEDLIMMCNTCYNFINDLIMEDAKFYNLNHQVKWKFFFDERFEIVAAYDKKKNELRVNVAFVYFAIRHDEIQTLDSFIIHELRHYYQHKLIKERKKLPLSEREKALVLSWSDNFKHYKNCLDDNKHEYYYQPIEYDAYSYSYAVMKYKYGKDLNIIMPKIFDNEFYKDCDLIYQALKERY